MICIIDFTLLAFPSILYTPPFFVATDDGSKTGLI